MKEEKVSRWRDKMPAVKIVTELRDNITIRREYRMWDRWQIKRAHLTRT